MLINYLRDDALSCLARTKLFSSCINSDTSSNSTCTKAKRTYATSRHHHFQSFDNDDVLKSHVTYLARTLLRPLTVKAVKSPTWLTMLEPKVSVCGEKRMPRAVAVT